MKFMLYLFLLSTSGILVAQTSHPAANAGASHNSAAQSSSAPGHPITACGSITSPGNYFLPKDLSCPGTALLLSGPGINLNLNGHTVTYGTAGGATGAVFGIENDACWDTDQKIVTVPCDNKNAGVGANIYGGSVVQSSHAPAFSHAFFFGQDDNTNQVINVHNVTITVQQPGTEAFLTNFQSGQILFENNTVYDNVTSINHPGQNDEGARAEFQGQAVFVNNSTYMASPDHIDNNKIIGSPQGGIRDTSTSANIYENDISMNSRYSNDYCVDVPGSGEQVYSNYCHPANGRGIHVNGEGSHIYNNDIVVTEAAVNAEYGGCEGGGAYAIQLEEDIHAAGNIDVTGNKGTLNTGACGGSTFRITGWQSGVPATISGNTWTVNKTAGADQYGGILYSVDNSNLSDVQFSGDTLHTTDSFCAGIDWDGAQNFHASLAGCTAPAAMASISGGGVGTFSVTNAPNTNLMCASHVNTTGTINGKTVKCH